jgi:transketolase
VRRGVAGHVDRPYGTVLAALGERHPELVVVDADLQRATETEEFQKRFPTRYFDVGIAEANMVGVAVGLALSGKTVFCGTFASFISQRVADQVFVSVAYCRSNVKLIGVEPGLSSGRNGASHQSLADLAIMRAYPGMVVCDPGDATETMAIATYVASYSGPAYMRVPRGTTPVIHDPERFRLEPARAILLRDGGDVTLLACGMMLLRALEAAELLAQRSIDARVLSVPFIKPLDEESILRCARETGCLVTAENHSIYGGLGGAVAEVVGARHAVPVVPVGIRDRFGQVGEAEWLAQEYRMRAEDIAVAAEQAIAAKKTRG